MRPVATAALVSWALVLGCTGAHAPAQGPGRMWTEAQAESIAAVRGMPVRVRHCNGLGRGREVGRTIVFARFSCLAGARLAHQPLDTVAITYVLEPLGPYSGASSRYRMTDVRFGGLGIP